MEHHEVVSEIILGWVLFVMIATLLFMFKRLSLRHIREVHYWPPGMYSSYRRRLRRIYFKTLGVSVLVAFIAGAVWQAFNFAQ